MDVALTVVSGDGEEMTIVTPSPLDFPVCKGPLNKDAREDLQIFSFLYTVGLTSGGDHPFNVVKGDDPPDRALMGSGGIVYPTEITQLTSEEIRIDLARIRSFGRSLTGSIENRSREYRHLSGRRIMLSLLPGEPLPRNMNGIADQILEVLLKDKGCIFDGVGPQGGLPDLLPTSGNYGMYGPIGVSMYSDGVEGQFLVVASAQANIKSSDTLAAFRERVAEKDVVANRVLLVSVGAPDERGFTCPPDRMLFQHLLDTARNKENILPVAPEHLDAVALHLWGTLQWIEIYRTKNSRPPWS